MADACRVCDRTQSIPYVCSYCGNTHCSGHRLPERHACPGVSNTKTRERAWFKSQAVDPRKDVNRRIHSRPVALDPDQIPTMGTVGRTADWKAQARERDRGPDLSPDGSLIYPDDEQEGDHVVAVDRGMTNSLLIKLIVLVIIGLLIAMFLVVTSGF